MKFRFKPVDVLIALVLTISLAFTGVALSLLYSTHNFVPKGVQPAEYLTVLRLRERDDSDQYWFDSLSLNEFAFLRRNFKNVNWFYEDYLNRNRVHTPSNSAHTYVDLSEVSHEYFSALGVLTTDGIPVSAPANQRVAVLAESVAEQLFGVLDRQDMSILLDGTSTAIPVVAIVSDDFKGLTSWNVKGWVVNIDEHHVLNVSDPTDFYVQSRFIFGKSGIGAASADEITEQLKNHKMVGRFSLGPDSFMTVNVLKSDQARAFASLFLAPFNESAAQRGSTGLIAVVFALVILMFFLLAIFFDSEQSKQIQPLSVSYMVGAAPHQLVGRLVVLHCAPFLVALALAVFVYFQIANLMLSYEPFKSYPGYLSTASHSIAIASMCSLLATCVGVSFIYGSYSLRRLLRSTYLTLARTADRSGVRYVLLFLVVLCMLFMGSNLSYFSRYVNFSFGFENTDIPSFIPSTPISLHPNAFKEELLKIDGVADAGRTSVIPLSPEFALPEPEAVMDASYTNEQTFYRIRVDKAFFDIYGVRTLIGELDDAFGDYDVALSLSMARTLEIEPSKLIGSSISLGNSRNIYNVIAIVDDVKYGNYLNPTTNVFYTQETMNSTSSYWVVDYDGVSQDVIAALDNNPLFTGIQFLDGPIPQSLLKYQYQSEHSEETLIAWTATIILMLTGAAFCWSVLKSLSDRRRFITVAYATGASVQDITISLVTPIARTLLLCVLLAALLIAFGGSFWERRNISIEMWVLLPILVALCVALALLVHTYVMKICGTQTVSYLLETES